MTDLVWLRNKDESFIQLFKCHAVTQWSQLKERSNLQLLRESLSYRSVKIAATTTPGDFVGNVCLSLVDRSSRRFSAKEREFTNIRIRHISLSRQSNESFYQVMANYHRSWKSFGIVAYAFALLFDKLSRKQLYIIRLSDRQKLFNRFIFESKQLPFELVHICESACELEGNERDRNLWPQDAFVI